MSRTILRRICLPSVFCVAIFALALYLPMTCYGETRIDFSPNIINIDGQRWGEIRIFTNVRYSAFIGAEDSEVFVYVNPDETDVSDSIENIRTTRDSLGNLILKFNLEDLLVFMDLFPDVVKIDDYNTFEVVVIIDDTEYSAEDDSVYIMDKRAP